MIIVLTALASIGISVLAQFCLKAGMASEGVRAALAQPFGAATFLAIATNPRILGGFMLYGLGAIVWLSVLARWEVSKAYPLVGFGFALTVLVGWMAGEQVGPARLLGVCFICIGVFLVARS